MKKMFLFRAAACLTASVFLVPSPARAVDPAQTGYETSFDTVARITGDLHQALERKQRPELSPAPVLTKLPEPYLQLQRAGGNSPRTVYLSRGWVDLLNFISHAKAVDGVSRGFLMKSMSRLAVESGNNGLPDLQANATKNAWSFATMNRQASSFNQMAGSLLAIEMAHACLGHYEKYASQLTGPEKHTIPINRVITTAEWHDAVIMGARHALDCGFAVDGLKLAFESIDKMPTRPSWRIYFLPDSVEWKEIRKLNHDLDQMQKKAFLSSVR